MTDNAMLRKWLNKQAAQERQARETEHQTRLAAEQEIVRLLTRLKRAGLNRG